MSELIKKLYDIAGSYSKNITKMLIYDVIKGLSSGISTGALFLTLIKIMEQAIYQKPIEMTDIKSVVWLGIAGLVGKIIFGYAADRNKYLASYSLGAENRLYIGDRLKNVNMGYFSENSLGTVSGGLSTVIGDLETVGIMIIEMMFAGYAVTLVMMVFVFAYDKITALIIFVTLLVATAVNGRGQKYADQFTEKLQDLKLSLGTSVLEYIQGMAVTKAFSKNASTRTRLEKNIENTRKGFLDVEKAVVPVQFLFLFIIRCGTGIIAASACYRYSIGNIDGVMAAVLTILGFIVFSGFELSGGLQNIKGIAEKNIDTVIELRNLPVIEEGCLKKAEKADIDIRKISFSYDGKKELFTNLSLKIPEKSTLALVGYSGSGKTTLCNLMARFMDVDSGEILVGGRNVKAYRYDDLLSQFSFVFQDVYLFEDTVRNNLKFGNPDAGDEEMIAMAKKAKCHEFIMAMPQAYDTVLAEGGKNLSGGERQRLSIARAMLKKSCFVILDEATSSVDPENERELTQAIESLLENQTVIIIAHKLSTVRYADQIAVMKEGKICQLGTHHTLIKEEGIYRKFVSERKHSEAWTVGTR